MLESLDKKESCTSDIQDTFGDVGKAKEGRDCYENLSVFEAGEPVCTHTSISNTGGVKISYSYYSYYSNNFYTLSHIDYDYHDEHLYILLHVEQRSSTSGY